MTWHKVEKETPLEPQYHGTRTERQMETNRKMGVLNGWVVHVDSNHLYVRSTRTRLQIFIHEDLTQRRIK